MLISEIPWEDVWPEHQASLRAHMPVKEYTFIGKEYEFRWIIEEMKDGTYRIRRPGAWQLAPHWESLDLLAAQCVLYALGAKLHPEPRAEPDVAHSGSPTITQEVI